MPLYLPRHSAVLSFSGSHIAFLRSKTMSELQLQVTNNAKICIQATPSLHSSIRTHTLRAHRLLNKSSTGPDPLLPLNWYNDDVDLPKGDVKDCFGSNIRTIFQFSPQYALEVGQYITYELYVIADSIVLPVNISYYAGFLEDILKSNSSSLYYSMTAAQLPIQELSKTAHKLAADAKRFEQYMMRNIPEGNLTFYDMVRIHDMNTRINEFHTLLAGPNILKCEVDRVIHCSEISGCFPRLNRQLGSLMAPDLSLDEQEKLLKLASEECTLLHDSLEMASLTLHL